MKQAGEGPVVASSERPVRWGTIGKELREAAQQLAKKGVPPPYFKGYLEGDQGLACYIGLHQGVPHMHDNQLTPLMRIDLDRATNIKGPFIRVSASEAARIRNRESIDQAMRPESINLHDQAAETLSPAQARQVLRVLQMSRNVTDAPLPLFTTNDHAGRRCVIGLDGDNICVFQSSISSTVIDSNRARTVEVSPVVYLGDAELEMYQNPWQRFNHAEHMKYVLAEATQKQQRLPHYDAAPAPAQPLPPAKEATEVPAVEKEISPLLSRMLTCVRIANRIQDSSFCCPFVKAIGPHQMRTIIGIRKLTNKHAELVLMEKNTYAAIRPLRQTEVHQYEVTESLSPDDIPTIARSTWQMLYDLSSIKVLYGD